MAAKDFSAAALPIFNGESYHLWAFKMKTYLRAFELWEVVETGREPPPLSANPTVAQMKHHSEESAKKNINLLPVYNLLCLMSFF